MNANELDPKYVDDLEKIIVKQQAEIEALKKKCNLLQQGYNASAILLGVETELTPDFFFMEHDIQGER